MNTLQQRNILKSMIKATNGLMFSVVFIKKDKSLREMVCRLGVEKHLAHPKGVGSNNQEHCSNLITVFDMQSNGYRSINLDTVQSFKCGSKVWNI